MAKKAKKATKKTAAKKTVKKKTTAKKAAVVKKTVKKKSVAKKTTSASKKAVKKKAAAKKTSVKKKVAAKKNAKKTLKKTVRKKAVAKKRASAPKRRRRPKTNLSHSDLMYFRELLIEKLKEISGDVNHIELESLRKSRQDASGDLSSMPIHMADVGSDNYEQEFALGLMDSERKIVIEIMAALKRIENNTYGICEGTQEPIPRPRLEGIPWTRYCVQYAEMLEKGLVTLDHDWYDGDEEEEEDDDREDSDRIDDDDDDDEDDDYDEDDEDDISELYYGFDDDDD